VLRRQRKRKTTSPPDLLVVGLGNPGEKYQNTRHNVGHQVAKAFSVKHVGAFKKNKALASCSEIRIASQRIVLAIPQTFMNESGLAVQKLTQLYNISNPEDLLIIHDELDLQPGAMKLKLGGGLAGHNGLKSIEQHIHTRDFGRLRIGIGKPEISEQGRNFVLKRPSKQDQEKIDSCVLKSIEAIETLVSEGYEKTMNKFNGDI
jgi:PTH1 family peptidyl-tRNA hydrolase